METLTAHEGFHCNGWVGCRRLELACDPFKGSAPVVVNGAKDVVVPFEEVGIFLVEEMEFGEEEMIEVSEHEGCWCLLGWWKVDRIEVGSDDTVLRSRVKVAGLVRDVSRQAGIPPR